MKAFSLLRTLKSGRQEDYRTFLILTIGYLATGLIPKRLDHRLVPRLLRSPLIVRKASVERTSARMESIVGSFIPDGEFERWAHGFSTMARENQWLRWRGTHSENIPVSTSVDGLDLIRAALERGKGVVLWGMAFCDTVVVKIALSREGHRVVQLSTPNHGLSLPSTEFGRAVVGPLYCVAENRFISERVLIPLDGSLGYMRILMQRLRENRCVYISGEQQSIRSNTEAMVFGKMVRFARGAPGLALKMDAPLLPVYVVREGSLRYKVLVDDPIATDRGLPKQEFVDEAITEFGRRIESHVIAHPADWEWWGYNTVTELTRTESSGSEH